MSQRIFNICTKKYGHLVNDPVTLNALRLEARNNPSVISEIVREANLEILNEASAREFCSEKVTNYFDNLPNNNTNVGENFNIQF